jgi:hypothetical protein
MSPCERGLQTQDGEVRASRGVRVSRWQGMAGVTIGLPLSRREHPVSHTIASQGGQHMADDRRHASTRPYPLLRVTGIALALVLTVGYAQAAEEFQRLSAREIRAQIIGKVITDDAHWSHHFRPNGTLHSIVLSQLRQGTWKINGHTLCLMLKRRKQETTTECYEVWRWKDHIEYRESGATVMTGFVRQEWR